MRLALAGLPFRVSPADALSVEERSAVARLDGATERVARDEERTFQLDLVETPPWGLSGDTALPAHGQPARVEAIDGHVRVSHQRFLTELEPSRSRGRLFRDDDEGLGIGITLRVALSARLPFEGGLPLHAAGVVLNGTGVAFFGPSGAGKTTLASQCPWRVLSDELVAVIGSPFRLWETGFWGALGDRGCACESARLGALVELAKGPGTELERLSPREALRRLLDVVLVPPQPEAWSKSLGVLGRLVAGVPVFRLAWSPAAPAWAALEEALAGAVSDA